jgi:type I restriction enzyme M protein
MTEKPRRGRPPKTASSKTAGPVAEQLDDVTDEAPRPKAKGRKNAAPDMLDPAHLTLAQLENHLWASANILRGPVDAADFKTYIFPLLFFKRISDVHDEEYQAALEEGGGDEEYANFPQNYRFQVPEGCHWDDVRAVTTNVGQALQRALRGIEQANPDTLYGIFGDAQWTNKERLAMRCCATSSSTSRIPLGNRVAATTSWGRAYEYLIKKFADATNKKAGEFYTPRSRGAADGQHPGPQEGETIYDPACGTGGMLLEAIHHVEGEPRR